MKKEPLRMCLVCKQMMPKEKLIRVVKSKQGEILIDLTGKMDGRGAYICKNEECYSKIKKQKVLNRAFRVDVNDEIYQKLSEVLSGDK